MTDGAATTAGSIELTDGPAAMALRRRESRDDRPSDLADLPRPRRDVIVADQLTKAWLVSSIAPGESMPVVGDYLRLVHSQNNGALFGLFRESAILFGLASIVVIGLIVAYHARSGRSLYMSVALGLLLGGAIGNLIDRLRLGYVVDFVDAGIGNVPLVHVQRGRRGDQLRDPVPHRSPPSGRRSPASGRSGAARPGARRNPGRAGRAGRRCLISACRCRCRRARAPGTRVLRVPDDAGSQRVDRFLADVTGLSRSHVQKLISAGHLTVRRACRSRRTA